MKSTCTGAALLETLLSLLVVSLGLLVIGRAQAALWASVDLARQQGEALQLAQTDLETQRHAVVDLARWDGLAGQAETALPLDGRATAYRQQRSVDTTATPPLHAVGTLLRWQDREGHWHRLSLHTLLARQDRRWAGWLALAPDDRPAATPQGRAATLPPEARTLSDGRVALKPRADHPDTWLFDAASGRIVAVCTAPIGLRNGRLQASDLGACTTVDARLLAGWIGFTGLAAVLAASDAEQPHGPVLPVGLQLTLSSTGHPTPAWRCLAGAEDEPHPDGTLPYWCLVQPAGTPAAWSGRLDLVPEGWSLAGAPGADAQARRVCRYSVDRDGNGLIDNVEHPAAYRQVQGALPQQNFLVIAAAATCPVDGPPRHGLDGAFNAVDDTTVAHQP